MQKKCDLYFLDAIKSDRIKFIEIFDKNFVFDKGRSYVGFLHVNVDRIKLVSVVSDLKRNGIACFNVPIAYRDHENLTSEVAFKIAAKYANTIGASVAMSIRHEKIPPVYWAFDLVPGPSSEEEKSGGVVMIDRLDGHIWTHSEYEEYLYDYNNVL